MAFMPSSCHCLLRLAARLSPLPSADDYASIAATAFGRDYASAACHAARAFGRLPALMLILLALLCLAALIAATMAGRAFRILIFFAYAADTLAITPLSLCLSDAFARYFDAAFAFI